MLEAFLYECITACITLTHTMTRVTLTYYSLIGNVCTVKPVLNGYSLKNLHAPWKQVAAWCSWKILQKSPAGSCSITFDLH